MAFLPDYGLDLARSGVRPDFVSIFYSFQLDHISRVGADTFTTMVTMPLAGVDHSLSQDFNFKQLLLILDLADKGTAERVKHWVRTANGVPTLDIPEMIAFGCEASLGEEQQNGNERYFPLVVQKVF